MRNLKKILALVLALAMSMSLVTIANAADFSDKADINYEEAVDVMTAIGVLEGFEDGSFKPGEILTREQAAKIICTMLLGENADKLGTTYSSFKDVAATRWSAPYIEYCASLGIIAGNGDGTYNPTGKLTGYAFAKMLLTALGYDAEIEGFVGAGWNLKVAAMASRSGILSDIADFIGTNAVTREQAAQMALSTLKAIKVEYVGNDVTVSGPDIDVTVGNNRFSYVENLNNTDGNIKDDNKMQFAEQHFTTLKVTTTASTEDDFGRPANSWSLKNVTIGNYAKAPAFTYTAKVSTKANTEANNSTILSALGLKGYSLQDKNGDTTGLGFYAVVNGKSTQITNVRDINDLTGNGVLVEVYTDENTADLITDVVVIKTELAQINRISTASGTVVLKTVGGVAADGSTVASKTYTVKGEDPCYKALSAMEKDDYVLIVPVDPTSGGDDYIAQVSVPTVVSGNLTKVTLDSGKPTGVTVDGSAYTLAADFSSKTQLSSSSVSSKTTSTAYVDAYGYVVYMKDVAASTNFIVVSDVYTSTVDGRNVTMVAGYDLAGNALTLNCGNVSANSYNTYIGKLKTYTNDSAQVANYGEYALETSSSDVKDMDANTGIAAGSVKIPGGSISGDPSGDFYFANGVTFIYLTYNDNGTVKNVTVKEGVQKVSAISSKSLQLALNNDGDISAVVVPGDADVSTGTDVVYVKGITGAQKIGNKTVNVYTIYVDGVETKDVVSTSTTDYSGKFCTYAVDADGYYSFNTYTKSDNATSVATATVNGVRNDSILFVSDVKDMTSSTGTISGVTELKVGNAVVVNFASGYTINSVAELAEVVATKNASVKIVFNNAADSSSKGEVAYIFVTAIGGVQNNITAVSGAKFATKNEDGEYQTTLNNVAAGTTVYIKADTANKAITSTTLELTTVTAPADGTNAVYSFTMPKAAVGASDFTVAS